VRAARGLFRGRSSNHARCPRLPMCNRSAIPLNGKSSRKRVRSWFPDCHSDWRRANAKAPEALDVPKSAPVTAERRETGPGADPGISLRGAGAEPLQSLTRAGTEPCNSLARASAQATCTPEKLPTVRRVGARGPQEQRCAVVGRVPPRGVHGCEECRPAP
jgi:hypothetical protein